MKLEQFQWTTQGGWDRPVRSSMLRDSAQLALMFGRAGLVSGQQCVRLVREVFPHAHLFGCSTGGEIHGTRVDDDSLALTVITFEHSRVETARAVIDSVAGSYAAGESLVQQLARDGLRHVFVLSEGLAVDSSGLVRGLNAALPAGVTVSGGFAADGNRFQTTQVWCDGEPESSAAVAIGLYGDRLHVDVAVTGGW